MSKKQYDLAVAYRIYPKVSKTPAIFADDKLKLSELCLRSFKVSLAGVRAKIWVLLDACPKPYYELFERHLDAEDIEFVTLNGIGNGPSFGKQMEILLSQNESQYVYFAEDDYFYLPGCFSEMLGFMSQVQGIDFVTPYDHLDYYTMALHSYKSHIAFHGKRHWRTAATTCLTFLTTKQALAETNHIFKTYIRKNYDSSLWLCLTKYNLLNPLRTLRILASPDISGMKMIAKSWYFCFWQILFGKRRRLWVPVPTLATHLEKTCLAPAVDWDAEFMRYI